MPHLKALFLSFCLVSFFTVANASESPESALGMFDFSLNSTTLDISRGTPEHTSISLSAANVIIEEQVKDFESYHVFTLPGEPFVMEEGNPSIPQISRFYRIPNTGGVDLVINPGEFELLENVNTLPLQF